MFASPRSELLALLAAIKAEPEEHTPTLALADWLQEQPGAADQARGEFLGLLVASRPERFPARLTSLWNSYETEWVGALRAAGFRFGAAHDYFRWGLLFPTVDGATVATDPTPVLGTEQFAWVAGATVRAADAPTGTLLADAPFLAPLVGLRVAPGDGGRAFLTRFAEVPRANALLELDLGGWRRHWHSLASLARSPHLTKLRRLVLRDSVLATPAFQFQQLWNAPGLPALRALDLTACDLDSNAVSATDAGTGLPALAELILARNRISDAGVAALAGSPRAGRLRKLDLSWNYVGEDGAAALTVARHLCKLTHLDLSHNHIPSRAAVELVTADHLRTIEELNLSGNDIGDAAAQALAQCPGLPNLRRLDLSGNRIGPRTAKALRNRFGPALVL